MSFLAPLAFGLAALALPILVLYMLKLPRREVEVSSTLLWQMLLPDREANAPWQKRKRNLLLFLQLLLLAALVLALARPFFKAPVVAAGTVVVLLDASASMGATDVAPSRFEAARLAARRLIDGLGADGQMGLILVGHQPEVLASSTGDKEVLRQALSRARLSQGAANWEAALALASGAVREAEAAYRRALHVVEQHLEMNPDDPRAATMRAVSLFRLGRQEEGLEWAERARRIDPEDPGVLYNVACLYALQGMTDRAIDCLEETMRAGFGDMAWIGHDPDLASLKDEPRFQAILSRA